MIKSILKFIGAAIGLGIALTIAYMTFLVCCFYVVWAIN